jgi:hypothetical protein
VLRRKNKNKTKIQSHGRKLSGGVRDESRSFHNVTKHSHSIYVRFSLAFPNQQHSP